MSFLAELWIPIIVSAVLVFIASSVIHMVVKWHNSDYNKLANEDAVRAAIRAGNPTPAQYVVPHCADMKAMASPEMQQKFVEGPIAFITLRPPGPPRMGGSLGMWFVYILFICVIGAYVAQRSLPEGATFNQVARVVGALSFLAYSGGSIQTAIWMGKPWSSAAKEVLDGIIYAAIAGAVFGWLWPR
ncbi:MAG: hypothetical protein ACXWBQ_00850 [Usitatibacter sp.]